MIAKKEWFNRRKYGGWGLTPKTKQGWFYILGVILSLAVPILFLSTDLARFIFTGLWLVLLFADISPIMFTLADDEREKKIESLAERNAAWGMMFVLVIGLLFEVVKSAQQQTLEVNIFLVIALAVGVLIKSLSNYFYGKKSL